MPVDKDSGKDNFQSVFRTPNKLDDQAHNKKHMNIQHL